MIYIIFAVTLAPAVEELVFRGVILNRLKVKFGITWAVFASSLIFGIVHFDFNVLGRLFFGILCALLFFETQNIVNCMILHVLNNASVVLIQVISVYINFSIHPDGQNKTVILIIIIFCCFVSSIILNIVYIKNNLPRKNNIKS